MWIKYNRFVNEETKRWVHPEFAMNSNTVVEKYLNPTDNTLFLVNTNLTDVSSYTGFNITTVDEANVEAEKTAFGAYNVIEPII